MGRVFSHIDKYFPAYFLGFLFFGMVLIGVRSELADRAFSDKCKQLGGVPRTTYERLCIRPGSLVEVPRNG